MFGQGFVRASRERERKTGLLLSLSLSLSAKHRREEKGLKRRCRIIAGERGAASSRGGEDEGTEKEVPIVFSERIF